MNKKLVNSELDKYRKRGKDTYTYCDVGCDCNIAVNLLEENQQLKNRIDKTTNYYYKKLAEYEKENKLMPDESVMMFNLLEGNK